MSDGSTAISVGGTTVEPQVRFRGTAADPEGGSWRLELEIRPLGTSFTGIQTASGPLVPSGVETTIAIGGFGNGGYHWQARAVDGLGLSSAWVPFGGNPDGDADFIVSTAANAAPAISSLGQFRTDGVTLIVTGGSTNQSLVLHRSSLADADLGQSIRMRVEVKAVGVAFNGVPSGTTGWFSGAGTAQIAIGGLVDGTSYHWRAWAQDTTGAVSAPLAFGGNSDPGDPDFSKVPNSAPYASASPSQLRTDGTTPIVPGGTVPETAVLFRATVSDPDPDLVQLEVEIQPLGTPFTGLPTSTSGPAANGGTAELVVSGLANKTGYHWQCRTIDPSGDVSSWSAFGGNSESDPDFFIDADFKLESPFAGAFGSRGSGCSAGPPEPGTAFLWAMALMCLISARCRSRSGC